MPAACRQGAWPAGIALGERGSESWRLVGPAVVPDVREHVDDHGDVVADVVDLPDGAGEPVDALEHRRAARARCSRPARRTCRRRRRSRRRSARPAPRSPSRRTWTASVGANRATRKVWFDFDSMITQRDGMDAALRPEPDEAAAALDAVGRGDDRHRRVDGPFEDVEAHVPGVPPAPAPQNIEPILHRSSAVRRTAPVPGRQRPRARVWGQDDDRVRRSG